MPDSPQARIEQLRAAIAALEAQRGTLGAAIDPALGVLRRQLAALEKDVSALALDSSNRLADLRRAAPDTLAQKILSTRSQAEGARKPVTILFTDIVGSTALAEKLDPEEWKEVVSGAHRRVSEAVYRYEGTIAQLLGDGVLAFFGAPLTHEDDPLRAVRAAIDIQQSIHAYADTLAGYIDSFQMRIGLHSGTVVVGSVGDDLHMEYLAIGDSVNLAARLQSAAQPGKILISAATARFVRAAIELNSLGEISVKGKAEPVAVWEVVGPSRAPASGRGIEGLASRLVGRERELESLCRALQELREGHGQIVAVLGEAGIGKTRLVDEARRIECGPGRTGEAGAAPVEFRWLEGRSLSYGQTLSFWAVAQLIKTDLGLSDADPEPRIRASLRKRGNNLFGERAGAVLPYLLHLLGVKLEGEAAEQIKTLDGETLKRESLLSIASYFEAVAREQPTVLVLEDAHWADPSTLEAVEQLFALTDRVPLMLALLLRPERAHGSWRLIQKAETDYGHRYLRLDLKPLSPSESNRLVENLLQIAELPEGVHQLILARSEGNPFYLEEVIRSLIEQGAIVSEAGRWRAPREMPPVDIPDTLQGVLLARIDRLEEGVRHTLQLASVIGKSFLYRLLEAIAEAERQLDRHLAELQRADLVREKTRRPEVEYMFKHSLTQEAAYQSILLERRKEFHRRVGEALEQVFADRREEYYGLLAHHFDAAGETAKAIDYLLRAGDKARFEDAPNEAVAYYRRAIALLTEKGDLRRAAETWLKLALVYHADFQFEAAHQANEAAFALAQQARQRAAEAPRPATPPGAMPRALRCEGHLLTTILDPGIAAYIADMHAAANLFAGLVELDTELNIVPHAARSWQVLDDGRRYLFHLREDVRWTDGTPVTAHDFEWSWKRNLAPATGSNRAEVLHEVVGAEAYHRGQSDDADGVGVRALDPVTLEVRLVSPVAYMPYLFADPITFPVPRHVIERYGDAWSRAAHIVSNGPFRLAELSPDMAVLERNPTYSGNFPGNLDQVELATWVSDEHSLIEYAAGRSQFAFLSDPWLDRIPPEDRHVFSWLGVLYLLFAPDHPPLDDARVRRALALALDRRVLAELSLGGSAGTPPARGGMVPPGIPGHTPDIGLNPDLAEARRLLAEAGYPGGQGMPTLRLAFTIQLSHAHWQQEAARQWRDRLGIDIALVELPEGAALRMADRWDVFSERWIADYPDPDNFLRNSSMYGMLRRAGWDAARYAALVDVAAGTRDRARRMALYREADRLWVAEEAVACPVTYSSRGVFACKPWVRNFRFSALGHVAYKNVTLDPH